jgi:chromate transporter
MLQKEAVERYHWVTDEELTDYYAISQCIPGIIAINTATFIGHKKRGLAGAAATTAGVLSPSLIIIIIIAAFIQNFASIPYVQHAFAGIRVAVCVLIINAVVKLWKSGIKDLTGVIIFSVVVAASILLSVSPILVIVLSAAAGIVISKVRARA